MNNTNFLPAQSIVSNGAITGNQWGTPANIFLVDQQYATSDVNTGSASDFIIGNFNLNLPQDAVPTGIEIEIVGHRGAQTSPVISLDVSLYDDTSGTGAYYPYTAPITTLTPNDTTIVIGGPTYQFASAFTVDQINNMKLAFTANGDISLDSVLVKVYYFIQTAVTPPTSTPGVCIDCSSPIQVQAMYLELPFLIGQTKFYLKKGSFSYPNGIPVQPGDIGSCGGTIPFVFDESKRKMDGQNFEENAMLDTNNGGTWIVLSSGVIEVDLGFVTQRGLDFHTPANHVAANMSDHDANSKVIISNNEPYNLQLIRTCQADLVFSPPITVSDENVALPDTLHDLDFRGAGVVAVNDGTDPHKKIITIPGAGGTTPPQVVSTISTTSGNVQVTSLSANLQISGLNRGVVIQVSTEELATITGITVGGVPATQEAVSTDVGANIRQESWFCQNPPLGSQAVVVTVAPAAYISFGAECVNGVDPSAPVGATQSATGTSFNPLLALITTTDYSIVIDGLATAQTPILYTPGAGQAANWNEIANTSTRQGGSSVESAGLQPDNITMDYAITQNTVWCYTAIEVVGITAVVPGSGQTAIQFQDEGINLGVAGTVDTVDVTGAGATASRVGNVVTINVPGGGPGTDELVGATATDTTPDFLDPKLNIHSNNSSILVTKTITNPGGNEIVDYDLTLLAGGGGTKIAIDTTPVVVSNTVTETTILSQSIPGGTLGIDDAISFNLFVSTAGMINTGGNTLTLRLKYGGTTVAQSVTIQPASNLSSVGGFIRGYILADGATNAQKGGIQMVLASNKSENDGAPSVEIDKISGFDSGTSAEDSTLAQTLEVTVEFSIANASNNLTSDFWLVESISQSSGADKKKVGVGESDDIQWYNYQAQFVDAVGATATWSLTGLTPTLIGVIPTGASTAQLTPIGYFSGTPGQALQWDSNKKVIVQGGIGYSASVTGRSGWGFGDIRTTQGSNAAEAIGFCSDAAGNWFTHVGDGGANFTENAITAIDDGVIHILRIEYNPATPNVLFYVDGILVDTIAVALSFPTSASTIYFETGQQNVSELEIITAPSFAVEI